MTQTLNRTDSELQMAVTEELEWTPNVTSTHIGVAVDGGAVTLSGEVRTFPERRNAERAALRVQGVIAVAEEITVQGMLNAPSDSEIAQHAGDALERAVDVPPGMVKAVVHKGQITLSGPVTWQYQREAAVRAVRYLKGVAGVTNTITLTPKATKSDIRVAISAALIRSAQIETTNIVITAERGIATLEGTVRSWAERQQAGAAAWSAPGVTDVRNRLRVAL